jgi:hypothetical protein
VVVCHSDLDLASGSGVHCRSAHSVVLTGAMTLDRSTWAIVVLLLILIVLIGLGYLSTPRG